MIKKYLTIFLLGICFLTAAPAWADTYKVDKDHTSVSFKIRHLFSNTQGVFKNFEGTIEYDPQKPETWSAAGTIQVDSIDTNSPERDKHLRGKDFFDVEQFPVISFKAGKVLSATEKSAQIEGLLTMHGVQKLVILDVYAHGVGKDPWGNVRAGFTATTTINRKDFGIVYNQVLDKGQLMLGEEVAITIELEAIKA